MEDLDVLMTDLDIANEENEELVFDEGLEEDSNRFELCVVVRFLTEKNINVRAMKSKLADLWRPTMGISIKPLKEGIFLFQFFHKDDMKWMLNNGPWSFDGALLVVNSVGLGEEPLSVSLNEVEFWIQIYNLPSGFMVESVGRQLGNFFGQFVAYDPSNNSSIWREYMRIRIKVDVRLPLKRKKKVSRKNKMDFVVNVKYEKLSDFCFLCGMLSHTERFCKKKLEGDAGTMIREWGGWLRAPPRRGANQERSKWLREGDDDNWGVKDGSGYKQTFQNSNQQRDSRVVRSDREELNKLAVVTETKNKEGSVIFSKAGVSSSKISDGPEDTELIGLELEERAKRKRLGPGEVLEMGVMNVTDHMDSVLSKADCTETSNTVLAQLAWQASQGK